MSWHVCVSGSSVGQSASVVVCNCMVPGSALGGILAFLLCAGLPLFVIKNQCLPFYSIIIIIIIIIQEFSSGILEVHVNENPQLMV